MFKNIKNISSSSFRVTTQELELRQILITEGIPFVFQKEFKFSDRSYFVDFFLSHEIMLECSYTRSFKYDVALRHKAILLEVKTSFIKQFHNYPMWVLFESERPIGMQFYKTLQKLMPSVDEIFISRNEILEQIQVYFNKTKKPSNVNSLTSVFFSLEYGNKPFFDKNCINSCHKSSEENYCPYSLFYNDNFKQLLHHSQNSPFDNFNFFLNDYSQHMKKKFIEKFEVFIP